MALECVKNTPGLWRDPNWQANMPGLYATIVGVSKYPYLRGGEEPAPDTFGLGQLLVSAATAAEVFEWLRNEYRRDGMPVVWCQVFLSPSEKERASIRPDVLAHAGTPNYVDLLKALQRWSAILPRDPQSAKRSRSLFFFSGHGVQSNWVPLLLPADYLDRSFAQPQLQNCFSAQEIKLWLGTHPVAEHLALFDACRNEFSPLAKIGASASPFLLTPPATGPVPGAVATFTATAPGAVAFQSEKEGLSFFGKALLEGLRGGGGAVLEDNAGTMGVEFIKLVGYVKPRINAMLKKFNQQLEQTARSSLEPLDVAVIVTQVPAPAHESLQAQLSADDAQKDLDARYQNRIDNENVGGELRPFSVSFGQEYADVLWALDNFEPYAIDTGKPLPYDAVRILRADADEAGEVVRVDLELPPNSAGVLLVFSGSARGGRLILPLPTDPEESVPIRITLTLTPNSEAETRNRGPMLERLEACLGPSDREDYNRLWALGQLANFGTFADAAKKADPHELIEVVAEKRRNPTAAIAGAIILARGGRILDVGDWTRNLMNWFPQLPDGAILWAETLRTAMARGQQPFEEANPLDALVDAVGKIASRGIPFFAETLELTDNLLRYLQLQAERLSPQQKSTLTTVRNMLDEVFKVARPSGQFLTLAITPSRFGNTGSMVRPSDVARRLLRHE